MKKIVVVTAAAGLLFSACGESGASLSADEQAVADQISEQFIEEFASFEGSDLGKSDGDCVGEKYVQELGTERLAELQVTAEDASAISDADFSADEGKKNLSIMKDCVGLDKFLINSFRASGVEKTDAECVIEKVDMGALEDSFGDPEDEELDKKATDELEKAAEECEVDF